MSFLIRSLILLWVAASLPACAIIKASQDKFEAYNDKPEAQLPYHHNTFDFKVAWNTSQAGNDMIIVGFIKNVQAMQVRGIELNVFVVDTYGRCLSKVSEGTVLPDQINLQMNDYVHFSVKLKNTAIANENILKFIIDYRINNGSWYGRRGQSIFYVDMATGGLVEELLQEQTLRDQKETMAVL